MEKKHTLLKVLTVFMLLFMISTLVSADVYIANSKDWSDVYAVLMKASLDEQSSAFTNSESLGLLTKTVSQNIPVVVYESNNPYVPNLDSQLTATGFEVIDSEESSDFILDLDPETGNYIVVSKDNFRTSVSLPVYAKKTNAWVLIVTPENSDEVSEKLAGADNVLAIGNFRRDVLEDIEEHFDEWINNNNIYSDSQELAKKFDTLDNVIIGDGNSLESEFFSTKNPVLLSGLNRILDETYDFLVDEKVKIVVLVGNELGVVGESIRSNSDKTISVFVKFGQSDIQGSGQVYALTYFPFPQPELSLTIKDVLYDAEKKELITYFENTGNAGMYFLNTLTINNEDEELNSVSDESVHFLGEGEILPLTYPLDISAQKINNDTAVQFYTSFGFTPTELDTFLTMEDKYGPPFSLQLKLGELKDDSSKLSISDVVYYKQYKRLGVTVVNEEDTKAYYALKVPRLVVNGVETDLFKEDSIGPLETKVTYLAVELDDIDLQENSNIQVSVQYGSNEDLLIKPLSDNFDLKVEAGYLLYIIIGAVVIILLIIILIVLKKK